MPGGVPTVMTNILVVRFGGSSATSPDLLKWVRAIESSTIPLVIVPGGGPFADTVRRFQPKIGYDDETAHRMAILAMEQFGSALVGLGTRMVAASSEAEIAAAADAGRLPVWMPSGLALEAPEIPKDWTVTSDSLSAWLAARLGGGPLLLLKQIAVPPGSTLEALAGAQIVDESFLRMLCPSTAVHVVGPADLASAGNRLAAGEIPGQPVAHRAPALETAP